MYGPYTALDIKGKKIIKYNGNKIFKPINDIKRVAFTELITGNRLVNLISNKHYFHLHKIDDTIFVSAVEYFKKIEADWCNLPITTLMISSPGEVYAGQTLDYTTDALPIELKWFDKKIFLAESSQFYLELRLLIENIHRVFSIYNSFRKEKTDFSHLSEFQHIEFEGHVDFEQNIKIFIDLLKHITRSIVKKNLNDLKHFLTDEEIKSLKNTFNKNNIKRITFKDALAALYKSTRDPRYKKFSLENFGSWEEIKLTEIFKKHVLVTEFPLMEIPFYHDHANKSHNGIPLAQNADFILYGYRETVGSGLRISDTDVLAKKAEIFNLPIEDYKPYLDSRKAKKYKVSAGFGMGWQRFTHWLLKLPYIWEASHIPRGHLPPKP